MRVLLDECLPKELAGMLVRHQAMTVSQAGWASKTNGELLAAASDDFDVFLTLDQNLQYQQNVKSFRLEIVVLRVSDNKLTTIEPLLPKVLGALPFVKVGQVVNIDP